MALARYLPSVEQRTSTSFWTPDPARIASQLRIQLALLPCPPRQHELARYRSRAGAILVMYPSGSLIVQGRHTTPLLTALQALMTPARQQPPHVGWGAAR